jgi:hypothetical protein
MEKLFDASVLKILKDGIKKGYWTLEDLDKPPPGWTECVSNTRGNKAFPQGYQGVEYQNLARVKIPKPKKETIEIIDPKDLPTYDF